MTDEAFAASRETVNAVGFAAHLLTVAAENSKSISTDIALPITKAMEAAQNGTLGPEIEAEFWAAYSQLCIVLQPISIASLKPDNMSSVRRQRRVYVLCCVLLLAILLPLSSCGFLVTKLNADIADIAESTCNAEPALGCKKPALSGQPQRTNDELKVPADVNYASYKIYRDNRWLDFLIFLPFTFDQLLGAYKCNRIEEGEDMAKIKKEGQTDGREYRTYTAVERNHERNISYADTFGGQVYFARELKYVSDLTYGVLGTFLLPPFYAMLGACAFGLRSLAGTGAPAAPVVDTTGPILRLSLAALTGFVVGLFGDITKGLAVSPLAVAFLIGYSAEIFFSVLDATIQATKPASRRTQ